MAAEQSTEDGGEGPDTLSKGNRHDHALQRYYGRGLYRCMGCKETGVNFGYECSDTISHSGEKIIFHVYCATLEDKKQHPIREDLTFSFRPKTTLQHRCTACDHELKGFVYKNKNSGMRLHPLCLMLPREFEDEGQRRFTLVMSKGDPYKCDCCGEEIKHGWKYICGKVCMAVGCVKNHLYGMQSSPVRRRRDHLKDVAKCLVGCIVPTAVVAEAVTEVVNHVLDSS